MNRRDIDKNKRFFQLHIELSFMIIYLLTEIAGLHPFFVW